MDIFRVPSMCFINSATLILFSLGRETGVVVSFGHGVGFISLIENTKQIRYELFDPEGISLLQVAQKLRTLVDEFQSNPTLYATLCNNITFSGGKTLLNDDFNDQFLLNLNTAFQQVPYILINNPSPRDDVVIGGCCLGMLGKFKEIIGGQNIQNTAEIMFSPHNHTSIPQLDFYNVVICTAYYWFRDMK